ncbi:MAG: DUF2927 domain-containing protein [Bacteroidota bacterium]|nr:DUF2927 domain-containing protein [Bacteroidota bacterium]
MNRIVYYLLYVIISGILTQCKSKNNQIPESDLAKIKQKYSSEAINYLYETAYFEDFVGPKDSISKWEDDIWISMEGDLWANDSLYVVKALEQLNSLDLPVELNITKDTTQANLRVYFGDYKYLEKKLGIVNYPLFLGIGVLPDHSTDIEFAKVGIANNAKSYTMLNVLDSAIIRQTHILEEITQALGIIGDSWKHYNSIFFEGKKNTKNLYELDKEVIRLLYEPSIPAKYLRKQFEMDFRDVLYHKNAKKKLISYVKKNIIPIRYLEYIRDNSFNDSLLFKYSGRIFVKMEGDFKQQDLEFCKKTIEKFNTISNQFQLEMAPDDIWHIFPCINIQFNDSTLQTPIAERFLKTGTMMFTRRILGTIKLSYRKSGLLREQENKNKLLFNAMYKILGFDHSNDDIIEIDSAGNILFKPGYQEILSFLYNPAIPSDFSQKEMDAVINALKKNNNL